MTPKLGVTLPQFTDDPERVVTAALRAEEVGLDSVWLFDHMWPLSGGKERPILEQWSTLAYLAAHTTTVTIGTLVTRTSLRHPAVLAKMVATVADIAPGRLIVTLGSGDSLSRGENDAFGIPYYAGDDRVAQLASTASLLRASLAGKPVTAVDEFAAIEGLPLSPIPQTTPPIWIAGNSQATMDTALACADGWNVWGKDAGWLRARVERLAGSGVAPTWGGLGVLDPQAAAGGSERDGTGSRERHVTGPPERFAETLRGLADAGAEHLIVTFPTATPATFEALARDVKPLL